MKKGYFVQGEFVAQGSERDEELKRELKGSETPSRTELKAQSAALQDLGERLLSLRANLLDKLNLPDALCEALEHAQALEKFEARRRQLQFIGKLMRKLDQDSVDRIRDALNTQAMGPAADTNFLHQTEEWRDRMVSSDSSIAQWIDQFPTTDIQHLRALVRQIRKDSSQDKPGAPSRHGHAYRELFQLIRDALVQPVISGDTLKEPLYSTPQEAS